MNLKPIFHFLIQEFSFTMAYISVKYKHVHNIHLEGTVSQICSMLRRVHRDKKSPGNACNNC